MRGSAAPVQSKALCVVWHAKHAAAPAALIAALDRPGFRRVECDNPYAAIAHLGRAHGQRVSLVLVLVEPEEVAGDIAGLLDVAQRVAPGLVLWAYNAGRSPSIRQVLASDFSTPRSPVVVVSPQHRSTPSLRLAGDTELPSHPPTARPTSSPQTASPAKPTERAETPEPAEQSEPRSRFMDIVMSENSGRDDGGPRGNFAGNVGEQTGGKPLLSDEELAMLLADDAHDAEDTRA
jgi:hypothetical protein